MLSTLHGIVLRTIEYGETSRIITVLSPEYGKLALMAKGARKPNSRLATVCQPFTYAMFQAYVGSTGMGTIQQSDVVDPFRELREHLDYMAYASYITELFDRYSEDRLPSEGTFQLLHGLLSLLRGGKDADILARIAEIRVCIAAGIHLDLYHCALCGNDLDAASAFSIRHAGPLCDACRTSDPHSYPLLPATMRLLRMFQRIDVARIGEVRLGDPVRRQLQTILREFMDTYSGVYIRSRSFLDQWSRLERDDHLDHQG